MTLDPADCPLPINHQTTIASLYLHVPFCGSRCAYCDFCSMAGASDEDYQRYLRALREEMSHTLSQYPVSPLDTMYIGGGSPSSLPVPALRSILSWLEKIPSAATGELTMECNPMDLDQALLSMLRDSPVNRLSIGIQSLDDTTRAAMNRRGSGLEVQRKLDLLAQLWPGQVSVDLMYGYPGQDLPELTRTLDRLLDRPIKHISVYELIPEEHTPLGQELSSGVRTLPEQDETDRVWHYCLERLASAGFERYEVSNWARDRHCCRHNQHYWALDSWLGFGPSAAANLSLPDGGFLRKTNCDQIKTYCSDPIGSARTVIVSGQEALYEKLMMAMRTAAGFEWQDLQVYSQVFPIERLARFFERWPEWFQVSERGVRVLGQGLDMLNRPLLQLLELMEDPA